jgi:hypothetical protein
MGKRCLTDPPLYRATKTYRSVKYGRALPGVTLLGVNFIDVFGGICFAPPSACHEPEPAG